LNLVRAAATEACHGAQKPHQTAPLDKVIFNTLFQADDT
jgi:hypothetical protein